MLSTMLLTSRCWQTPTHSQEPTVHVPVYHYTPRTGFPASRRSAQRVSTASEAKWLRHADPHIIASNRPPITTLYLNSPYNFSQAATLHLTSLTRLTPDLLLYAMTCNGRGPQGPFCRSLPVDLVFVAVVQAAWNSFVLLPSLDLLRHRVICQRCFRVPSK
jgi:hypothetical protein